MSVAVPERSEESLQLANAVSFLSDANVKNAPLDKKIAFLESKGLSKSLIENALKLAESAPPSSTATQPSSLPAISASSYWKDVGLATVLSLSVTYSLYHLSQTYLIPYFNSLFNKNDLESKLSSSINDLNSSISTLNNSLQSQITKIQIDLDRIKDDSSRANIDDIQKEIKMIKSLVLGSTSFKPISENSQSSTISIGYDVSKSFAASAAGPLPEAIAESDSSSVIPAWQLAGSEVSE